MKLLLFILPLIITSAASALDVCPAYHVVHDHEVMVRINSGIPFKLLSIATDGQISYRRMVQIQFDLWSEVLTIEAIGKVREFSKIKESEGKICHALSMPEATTGHKYRYQLLLNPVLGEGFKKLKNSGESGSGLLQVNWQRLAKDLETEKVLIENEIIP